MHLLQYIRPKSYQRSRREYAKTILGEVSSDTGGDVSGEVWSLAHTVLNGSKAETEIASRTLAGMVFAFNETERQYLLRLMSWLLFDEPSWRIQAASDLVLSIKSNRTASTIGRIVDMAYRADPKELREFLCEFFSLEELKTLCADIGVDYEILTGEGKEAKARELVDYCRRQGHLAELLGRCRELRPTQFSELPGVQSAGQTVIDAQQEASTRKVPLPPNVVAQIAKGVYAITCGFCQGKGRAPSTTMNWKIETYSSDTCYVCKGKGTLRVETSDAIVVHGACQGTGLARSRDSYRIYQCEGCHGLGVCSLSGELRVID